MRVAGSLLGLAIVLVIGWFIIKTHFAQGPEAGTPPKEIIELVGVKSDLLAIAQAERVCLATNGTYASLEQLEQEGAISFPVVNRRGYNYSAEINDGQHFKIAAIPSQGTTQGWPTLSIDENMEVRQE